MNKKIQLLSLVLGFILVLGASSGTAVTISQQNSGNIQLETDEFVVKVTGGSNVPMYTFWDTDDTTTKYKVQFNSIFEVIDSTTAGTQGEYDENDQRVSGSPVTLAAQTWEFSEITEDDNGDVHFDLSSTISNGAFVQFANHLYADQASSIKFDVVINDYPFKSSDSLLVLGFKVTEQTESDEEAAQTSEASENQINFGDGFFNIEDTAEAGGSTIGVGLSSASEEGNSKLYVAYENFDGSDLVHDPTMGVQASDSNTDDGNGGPNLASDESINLWADDISRGAAGLSSFFASIIALVVPVTLYRSRK